MLKDMSTAKLTNGLLEWAQAVTDGYAHLYYTDHLDMRMKSTPVEYIVALSLYSRPTYDCCHDQYV